MKVYAVLNPGDWQGGNTGTLYGVYSTRLRAEVRLADLKARPDAKWRFFDLGVLDLNVNDDMEEAL